MARLQRWVSRGRGFFFSFFFVFRNLGFRVWLERVRLGWGFPTRFKWVLAAGSGIRRGWNGIYVVRLWCLGFYGFSYNEIGWNGVQPKEIARDD